MILVYLKDENQNWELYKFDDWFQARIEFKKRNIKIAENSIIEQCYISDNVTIKSDCILKYHTTIGSNTIISQKCFFREYTVIGSNCEIGNYVILEQGVKIGDNCKISNNIHLNYRSIVEDDTILDYSIFISDKFFDRCISYVGNKTFFRGCGKFYLTDKIKDMLSTYESKKQKRIEDEGIIEDTYIILDSILKPFYILFSNK